MIDKSNLFVLIHSPLVGPLTWSLVADKMRQRGLNVLVPALEDSPHSNKPFWKQHAESISQAIAHVPHETFLTLIGHSGAGPLLPAIRALLPNPVRAYVFVDAGIPHDNRSRLDVMKSEVPEWAKDFQEELEHGGRFPTWSSEDLQEILPDKSLRDQMVAELRPRALDFFTEPIPVFAGWPDAPCMYIHFSPPYDIPAAQARQADWQVATLEAGHFHMLVDPIAVTDMILSLVAKQT